MSRQLWAWTRTGWRHGGLREPCLWGEAAPGDLGWPWAPPPGEPVHRILGGHTSCPAQSPRGLSVCPVRTWFCQTRGRSDRPAAQEARGRRLSGNEDAKCFQPRILPDVVPDVDRGGTEAEAAFSCPGLRFARGAEGTVPTRTKGNRRGRGFVERPLSQPSPHGALPGALHRPYLGRGPRSRHWLNPSQEPLGQAAASSFLGSAPPSPRPGLASRVEVWGRGP